MIVCFGFFFSSRRRHTRWPRDWSSDVCSSDLGTQGVALVGEEQLVPVSALPPVPTAVEWATGSAQGAYPEACEDLARSEERRVGKECRCGGAGEQGEEKEASTGQPRADESTTV